ncbi:MAG TPA: hypothetical protein VFR58_01695 [Flavisolibacter sp.]|nr:hypothetical protein [Flavisolibacter sp.]
MKILLLLGLCFCSSCFLLSDFSRSSYAYTGSESYSLVVPRGYNSVETAIDSSGNELQVYSYPGGATLYFIRARDTAAAYQPINYGENISRKLYHTIFYKGIDSSGRYWRETRFGGFKAGYRTVAWGRDWKFDSAINYFSLLMVRDQ